MQIRTRRVELNTKSEFVRWCFDVFEIEETEGSVHLADEFDITRFWIRGGLLCGEWITFTWFKGGAGVDDGSEIDKEGGIVGVSCNLSLC